MIANMISLFALVRSIFSNRPIHQERGVITKYALLNGTMGAQVSENDGRFSPRLTALEKVLHLAASKTLAKPSHT